MGVKFSNCGRNSTKFSTIDCGENIEDKRFCKLSKITERPLKEINELHSHFTRYCENGVLNEIQFYKLYSSMRFEDSDRLAIITDFIFKAFDKNKNGTIDFEEFAVKIIIVK